MNDELCRLVKQARIRKGLTQEQAGGLIYLSRSGYSKAERGERDLDTEQTVRLCRCLGIPVQDMLSAIESGMPPIPDKYREGGTKEMDIHEIRAGENGWSVMEGTKILMADALARHPDYVCLAAGLPYYDGNTEIENLGRLMAEVMLSGDRLVTSPIHRLSDALDGHLNIYGLSPELQDDAAAICIDLAGYWDGRRELPLKQVLANILWNTDFQGMESCPAYAGKIGALRQRFADEMNAKGAAWRQDAARRSRIEMPMKAGQVLELHGSGRMMHDPHEYVLLVEESGVGSIGRRAKSWMIVMLRQEDDHSLLETIRETPSIEVHIAGGQLAGKWYADTGTVYKLDNNRIYDVVGEVDKPALDVVRDAVDRQFKAQADRDEFLDGAGYGSCIQYRSDGILRRGIIAYIDDAHVRARLLDVFFLTDAEAAVDSGYIRLSKDTREPDGELFYNFDFPDNVGPYLKRGSVTVFEDIRDAVSDVRRLGSWPSQTYTNDRVRELSGLVDTEPAAES